MAKANDNANPNPNTPPANSDGAPNGGKKPKKAAPLSESHQVAVAAFDAARKAFDESNGHHNAKILCRMASAKLAAVAAEDDAPEDVVAAAADAEAWVAKNAPEPKK